MENIELQTRKRQNGQYVRLNTDQLKSLQLLSLQTLVLRNVDAIDVCYATKQCPLLKSLDITTYIGDDNSIQTTTDIGLYCIGSQCPLLEKFSLTSYGKGTLFTADYLTSFFRGCQSLKTVKLPGGTLYDFSAADIESLQPFGYLFEHLRFAQSSSWHSKAFNDLLAHSSNLLKVKIDWDEDHEVPNVLISLAQHCQLLKEICVSSDRNLDAGLSLLSKNCKNLVKIEFDQCGALTDASFQHIANIQSLEELACIECYGLIDAGVAALMRGCPNLRDLQISSEELTSAEGFRVLRNAPFVHSLIEIYIYGNMEDHDGQLEVIMGEGLACCHDLVKIALSIEHFGDVGLALMCSLRSYACRDELSSITCL